MEELIFLSKYKLSLTPGLNYFQDVLTYLPVAEKHNKTNS